MNPGFAGRAKEPGSLANFRDDRPAITQISANLE